MSETQDPHKNGQATNGLDDSIITLKGMYKDYFLDYASYVILERAVPAVLDGLKPVQRRILHSMKQMDDGRYHKVANIIGQTMQYHPHGDAAIGDALVNLGQKDLMIDPQGNWGDSRTGDRAAASRYIEARLTKFALEVAFNPQTTEWQLSYDGRKKEPIHLPMKFPLLLCQGAEGIAVGLSTKILPHNFIELIKASIKILEGKRVKIYPDFDTRGLVDVADYQGGKRGGRVKVRCHIEKVDNKNLVIRDLPYGITTTSLIDSIIKANDKGKIKIKRVTDNTAADIEIAIELASGVSPDLTVDALYAFTNCELSISPNACVIIDDKPHFLTVEELLHISTESTKALLKMELEIRQKELEEKLHFASLEKIFIEKRIYRDIEEAETWEAVLEIIETGLRKYVRVPGEKAKAGDDRIVLLRDITEDDIVRLTEIKIKRISKYNTFKAEEQIAKLEEELAQVKHDLANLTTYAIAYFEHLLSKYGKGQERKTEITTFDKVQPAQVVVNNAKLYANLKEGFVGMGLKKDTFITDCSDIDDIIVFRRDGKFMVTRIADKTFVGKNIIHVAVWKKGDERTTYNMVYLDAKTGRAMIKRFNVTAITRDKEYDLTTGHKLNKTLYFSANPNGEAEIINVQLSPNAKARIKNFDVDFSEIAIKGRGSKGNIMTRYGVRKTVLKEAGKSTLGAMKLWMDEVSGRLNKAERGLFLGAFDTGDQLLAVYTDGSYEVMDLDLNKKFEPKELFHVGKYDPKAAISAIYYEGERKWTMVKRFNVETTKTGQRYPFLTEHKQTKLLYATVDEAATVAYNYRTKEGKVDKEVALTSFIDVKGWKSLGNKLEDVKITIPKRQPKAKAKEKATAAKGPKKLSAGDSIEFDLEGDGQTKMFD
ncbi:MAG: DNA gyrase/topoisomerase IV subunit A [Bacteroidota bacterium]